jgi:hypothetical protein
MQHAESMNIRRETVQHPHNWIPKTVTTFILEIQMMHVVASSTLGMINNTGPSAAGERPLVGCQHLPPTCYSSDADRKIMPPLMPLRDEQGNYKLFTVSDKAHSSLGIMNEGHGTEFCDIKLKQQQQQQQQQQQNPVPSLQQMKSACSSVKIPGNILAVTVITGSFQENM